jgi:hypothetical protein
MVAKRCSGYVLRLSPSLNAVLDDSNMTLLGATGFLLVSRYSSSGPW